MTSSAAGRAMAVTALGLALVATVAWGQGNVTKCSGLAACKECTKNLACLWCRGSSVCVPGKPWGKSAVPCATYRWGQCWVDGKVVVIAVPSALAALILLLVVLVCCCCCCCRRRGRRYDAVDDEDLLDARHRRRRMASSRRRSSSPSRRASLTRINETAEDSASANILDPGAQASRTPLTDKRREEMKAKWGAF